MRVGLNSGASDAMMGSVSPEQDGGAPGLKFAVCLCGFCPFVGSEVLKGGTEMYHQEGGKPVGSPTRWVGEGRRLAGLRHWQRSEGQVFCASLCSQHTRRRGMLEAPSTLGLWKEQASSGFQLCYFHALREA